MSTKPSVLFVCVHNAGRSQMAAGWLRHLAGDAVEVRSAGSAPADTVNPAADHADPLDGVDRRLVVPAHGCAHGSPVPRRRLRWSHPIHRRRPLRPGE